MLDSLKSFAAFVVAIVSFVIGQLPAWASFFGGYLNFYQPAIYKDKGYLLVMPFVIGMFCTWIAFTHTRKLALWVLLLAFCVSFLTAHFVREFDFWSADHWIHPLNWMLFYCAIAVGVAMVARILFDVWLALSQAVAK